MFRCGLPAKYRYSPSREPAALVQVYTELFEAAGEPERVQAILDFSHADDAFEPGEAQMFETAVVPAPGFPEAPGGARRITVQGGTSPAGRAITTTISYQPKRLSK